MLAPIAVQPPSATEAPRSQTSDAKANKGKFSDILEGVQSRDRTRSRDVAEAEETGGREAKIDQPSAVAAMFMQAPPEGTLKLQPEASAEAEQALVATAEAVAGDVDAMQGDLSTDAAATGADSGNEFSDLIDTPQAETDDGAATDADAAQEIESKLRLGRDGQGAGSEADKMGAGSTDTADAQATDDLLADPRAAAPQQPSQAQDGTRPGAHPLDMHHMQADAKPVSAQLPAAQPQPATQAVQVPLDGVAVQIAKAATDGIDRFRIELHPASLGGIDISLEISRDGRVDAVVRADRPETLELLQRDARQLARALQDAGLQADSGSFAFQRRDEDGRQPSLFARSNGPASTGSEERGLAIDTIYRTIRPSGVDLRV